MGTAHLSAWAPRVDGGQPFARLPPERAGRGVHAQGAQAKNSSHTLPTSALCGVLHAERTRQQPLSRRQRVRTVWSRRGDSTQRNRSEVRTPVWPDT